MLFVVFRLGEDRYALDARAVVEVLPLVDTRPVAGAPSAVAGVFLYRGTPAPVIDLASVIARRPSERRSGTRLIIVEGDVSGARRHVALMAERATETIALAAAEFSGDPVSSRVQPALGGVAVDALGMIQQVDADILVTEVLRDAVATVEEIGA